MSIKPLYSQKSVLLRRLALMRAPSTRARARQFKQAENQPEVMAEAERTNDRKRSDRKASQPPRALFRLLGHYYSGLNLTLSVTEWLVLFCSLFLGVAIRFDLRLPPGTTSGELLAIGIVYATVISFSITAMGLYQRGLHDADAGRFRLAMAFIGGTAALALVYYLVPAVSIGRGVIGLTLLFSFLGSAALREGWRRLAGTNVTTRRVLVLGAGNNARRIADLSAAIPALRVHGDRLLAAAAKRWDAT